MCGVSGHDSSVIDNELSATVQSGDCQRIKKSAYLSKPILRFSGGLGLKLSPVHLGIHALGSTLSLCFQYRLT